MVEYNCKKCKYSTNIKTHYNRHCSTKKHKRNDKNEPILNPSEPTPPQKEEIINTFNCTYCDKHYSTNSHMNRHLRKCEEKTNLKQKLENSENERRKLEKEKTDIQIEYNDFLKSLAKRPTFSNTYNVSKASYILSTFPNAPTLKYMLDTRKVSNEEILLCLEKGIIKGPALYIYKKCAAELEDHLKPIWCTR
jgi:hypothetical protein